MVRAERDREHTQGLRARLDRICRLCRVLGLGHDQPAWPVLTFFAGLLMSFFLLSVL